MFGWFKKKRLSINDQLENLQSIGITLKDGLVLEKHLNFNMKEYEEKPYLFLLIELGSEQEIENKFDSISNNVWYFDTECIEGHGDYAYLIDRIQEMINAEIHIDHIGDYVDIEEGIANISFTANGNPYKYDLEINDDWVDGRILEIFSMLLMEYGSNKRFFYADIDQCLLVVLIEKEHYLKLNEFLNIFIPA